MEPENATKIIVDGEEISLEEAKDRLKKTIKLNSLTVSVGEKRKAGTSDKFEMNDYFASCNFSMEGFVALSSSTPELQAVASDALDERIRGAFSFLKFQLHEEQKLDKIFNITERK